MTTTESRTGSVSVPTAGSTTDLVVDPVVGPDAVLDLEPGRRVEAVRHVPHTLDVFDSHFPRFPVLPGMVILDELVAAAGLALGGGPWRLVEAEGLRYRHYVEPGSALHLRVEVRETGTDPGTGDRTATCTAKALVADRVVTTVKVLRVALSGGAA